MAAPSIPQLPPSRQKIRTHRRQHLGVYLDRASLEIDPRGMSDCRNVRVRNGRIRSENHGWEKFPEGAGTAINLDQRQVLLIDQFFLRSGAQILIFGNHRDLFQYDEGAGTVSYITPIYATGTVTNSGEPTNQDILGSGTAWDTAMTTLPTAGGFGTAYKNAVIGMEISFGSAVETDPTATWYGIDAVTDDTHLHIDADPGAIAPGTSYTIRQVFTGDNLDLWQTEIFQDAQEDDEDKWFATNGREMVVWNGTDDQVEWFYPGFVTRDFLYHKQIMMAGWATEGGETLPSVIKTSRLNYPEDYATEEATQFVPTDGVSELQMLVPLGDLVVAYYERDIILLQYVGPPLFWIARTAIPGLGLLAPNALMDFGDYHEFLSADAAYRFDGVTLEPIGTHVFREVLRKQAPNRVVRAFAHIDEENGDVLWVVPLTTDGEADDQAPTTAYVEHYLEDVGDAPIVMTIRDFPVTATGFFQRSATLRFNTIGGNFDEKSFAWNDRVFEASFPFNLIGLANGDVMIYATTDTKDGTAIMSYARLPRQPCMDGQYAGLVQWVEPHCGLRGSGMLDVEVGFADFPDGPLLRVSAGQYALDQSGDRRVPIRGAGRFYEVDVSADGATEQFDLGGISVAAVPLGDR